jgi:cell division protein FtsI (penicillin-binding protein 3)
VDDLWALDPSWGNIYKERAKVPEMRTQFIGTQKGEKIPVPNVIGMGLMDAIYAIENNGYKCSHEGMGHVVSQSLKAGETYKKGETIKIVLK